MTMHDILTAGKDQLSYVTVVETYLGCSSQSAASTLPWQVIIRTGHLAVAVTKTDAASTAAARVTKEKKRRAGR